MFRQLCERLFRDVPCTCCGSCSADKRAYRKAGSRDYGTLVSDGGGISCCPKGYATVRWLLDTGSRAASKRNARCQQDSCVSRVSKDGSTHAAGRCVAVTYSNSIGLQLPLLFVPLQPQKRHKQAKILPQSVDAAAPRALGAWQVPQLQQT